MKMHIKFRRRISYLLLPAMTAFMLSPTAGFASIVYTGAGNGNNTKSTSGNVMLYQSQKLMNSYHTAKNINKLNSANKLKSSKDSGQSNSASPSSSYANNYTLGIGAQVNAQTGQLGVNFNNIKLSGITDGVNIDFGLSNSGVANKKIFGFPEGWKCNLDYIDTSNYPYVLHTGSSQNYTLDSFYKSGLKYCITGVMKLTDEGHTVSKTFTRNNVKTTINYRFIVTKFEKTNNKQSNEYFNGDGLLVCSDDENGNFITYHYTPILSYLPADVYNVRLNYIIDSYGQLITFSSDSSTPEGYDDGIVITMPDGRYAEYMFKSDHTAIEVRSLTGRTATIELENLGTGADAERVVSKIIYPTGGSVQYHWDQVIPYVASDGTVNHFWAVSEVDTTDNSNSSSPVMVTKYNYIPNGAFSFAGSAPYSPAADNLMSSTANSGYHYYTKVEQTVPDGTLSTTQKYNYLHLPVEKEIYYNNGSSNDDGTLKSDTNITYLGEKDGGFNTLENLAGNYNQPYITDTTVYGSTGSNGSRNYKVKTDYNDYGQPTVINKYNNGNVVSTITNTYCSDTGQDSAFFGHVKSHSVYDSVTGMTTTTLNDYSSSDGSNGGDYKETSTISNSKNGCNDTQSAKQVIATVNSNGLPVSKTIQWADQAGHSNNSDEPTSATTTTGYDSNGGHILTVKSTDDAGNVTSEEINTANGFVIKKTDAEGNYETCDYPDNGLKVVTKSFDKDGNLTGQKTVDNSNPNTIVTTDSTGRVVTQYLDGLGRVYKETDSFCPANNHVVMTKTYNCLGKVASETDVYGHTATFKYDDWQGRETSSTDFLGNTSTTKYDDTTNTAITYDNGVEASKTYFDDNGNCIEKQDFLSGTGDNNCLTESQYDGKDQKIYEGLELTQGDSQNGIGIMSTDTTYDINGKSATVHLHAQEDHAGSNATDVTDGVSTFNRDLFGDLIQRTTDYSSLALNVLPGPSNQANGNVELKSEKKYFNNLGQMVKLENQLGQSILYTYDADGDIKTMTDFAGTVFKYTYNGLGKMINMTYTTKNGVSDTKTITYYTTPGKPDFGKVHTTSMDSKTITYEYDNYGQISKITYPDNRNMTFTYDQYGNVTAIKDYANEVTHYSYSFGKSDEPVITDISNDLGSVHLTYCDKNDAPLLGDGTTIKTEDFSNGIEVAYKYYNMNSENGTAAKKAPKIKDIITKNSNDQIICESEYTYSKSDRVKSIKQSSQTNPDDLNCNNTKIYSYNSMGQLINTVVQSNTNNKILDTTSNYFNPNGDFLAGTHPGKNSSDDQSYTYNAIDHIQTVTENGKTIKINYDVNGNMLNDDVGNVYHYNALNQLTEFDCHDPNSSFNGCTVEYSYLPNDLREAKWMKGDSKDAIYFYYNPDKQMINAHHDNIWSVYLMSGSDRIARECSDTGSFDAPHASFYIKNAKDIMGIADNSGHESKQNCYQYTSYGRKADYNKS